MKFYNRDPDAALSGMAGLSLQERGAYNTIIDLLYSRDGVLVDDDETIRRSMGCHGNEWRSVKRKLIEKGKLWIEGIYLKAKRVDDTLKEAENKSESQRKRAAKRWEIEGKHPTKTKKDEQYQKTVDAIQNNIQNSPRSRTRRAPRAMIADGWTLNEKNLMHADAAGFAEPKIAMMARSFHNYHRSRGTLLADVDAAWRNWVDNEVRFNQRGDPTRAQNKGQRSGGYARLSLHLNGGDSFERD